MYLRAVSAVPDGNVSPEKYSSLLSAAWAMIDVPSTVARSRQRAADSVWSSGSTP